MRNISDFGLAHYVAKDYNASIMSEHTTSTKEYFSENDTLFDITERYPQTIRVFAANGFPHMDDPVKRASVGKNISLKQAVKIKGKRLELFLQLLIDAIDCESGSADISLRGGGDGGAEISVVGALPCPVRIPLIEQFAVFIEQYRERHGASIGYDLRAASQGAGWMEEYIHGAGSADGLPDIFMSAGFEMFFDQNTIGRYKAEGAFEDLLPFDRINSDFDSIDIIDPRHDYSVISVVPAVFLVNTDELGDLPIPACWADVLQPHFENRVSLPVGDFDMFSSLLIHIFKAFGSDGVRMLGRCLLESMHPAEMVKSGKKKTEKPIVTIMPYFFTKMTMGVGPMKAVWPKDGAIISPIFLLARKSADKEIQPIVDFFASDAVGEILAHKGMFPSLNPCVDNRLQKGSKFMWIGWDYIYNNDVAALIKECEGLFNGASR